MLRELASLLIQARDTAGYVDVRQKLFNLEPGNRANWIALAVAHYLHGEFEATYKMLLVRAPSLLYAAVARNGGLTLTRNLWGPSNGAGVRKGHF
jgi:hypothetical protein